MSIGTIYLDSVIKRFQNYKELSDKTFLQLSESDFHFQPNDESNSIAIIIQHMSGNMLSRWTNFLDQDGEKSWRKRDDEFETHSYGKKELLEIWESGWNCMFNTLGSLTENELMLTVHIRTEALSVVDAINRQIAHYSYHVGQIVYIGKILKNDDWKTLSIPRKKSA